MPTFNGAQFLQDTLQSIRTQKQPVSELIISDDDSEDETLDIARQFANTAPFEVKLLNHQRQGVTANYLHALKHASGELIFVADQDDVWLPEKTSVVTSAFENDRVQLVSHDCTLVSRSLEPLGRTLRGTPAASKRLSRRINNTNEAQNLRKFLIGGLPLLAHTLCFRKSLVPYLLAKPAEIDEWWFEEWVSCIAATHGRVQFVPDQLVLYRQHDMQTSGGLGNSSEEQGQRPLNKDKYHSRIMKIRYCANLIKNGAHLQDRHTMLTEYVHFLECRQIAIGGTRIKALSTFCRTLISGAYHRFANGLRSAGLDLITWVRISKQT